MGRLGIQPGQIREFAQHLRRHPTIRLDGVMTHFAGADSRDAAWVEDQCVLFGQAITRLQHEGFSPKVRHAANSAAVLSYPATHLDWVRTGIALFGVAPGMTSGGNLAASRDANLPRNDVELRSVLQWSSSIIALRDVQIGDRIGYGGTWRATRPSRIATLPVGYADGLSRGLSNCGHILIRGHKAPIVGTISMDLTTIDVTDHPGASLGDEGIILGKQQGPLGEGELSAEQMAQRLDTIPWEIFTKISRRVPRFYRES